MAASLKLDKKVLVYGVIITQNWCFFEMTPFDLIYIRFRE